ncbi:CHAT domain-containing protein [Salsipaludibacter albus]|uniref:CHAT domain-containing protein n=1 Tax=Salsipaludibacter albus TaxID=2849650 RepID=UPI001EE3C179|nr:CHAT domain-containing protein [Salsipaludibacter albus]MBY5163801.1 CHAT domain-containing protein [Salsipaludibacter albus]
MDPVVVLDARTLGRHAHRAVEGLDDADWVLVTRRGLDTSWTAVRVGEVRTVPDEVPVGEALDLDAAPDVTTWDPGDDVARPDGPACVVGPDGPVGSLHLDQLEPTAAAADPPRRGFFLPGREDDAGTDERPTTRSWNPPPTLRGDGGADHARPPAVTFPDTPTTRSDPPPTSGAEPPQPPMPEPPSAGAAGEVDDGAGADGEVGAAQDEGVESDGGDQAAADDGAVTQDLTTFPRMEAPEQVTAATTLELVVGLGDAPMPTTGDAPEGGPMRVVAAGPTVDLEIQVVAPDFTMPAGGRRFLHVRTDDPSASSVTVPLVAPAVEEARRTTVRVEYVHGGMPIGQAWREVVVTPTDERVEATVETGAAAVTVSDPANWADLTVMVSEGPRPDVLTWSFFTAHDVDIPEQADRGLDAADARDFAHQQVVRLGQSAGSELEGTELAGVSRIVADVMPPEFWEALAAVAAVVDQIPSLFLVTADAWIPWELASTEPAYLPPEVVDADVPMFLGAQFRVARWLEQRKVGRMTAPVLPPLDHHTVGRLCLVIGDYLAANGQRPLPAALAEGDELKRRYPYVWKSATATDLAAVLGDRIVVEGRPVEIDALHLACHGRVSDDVRETGIVLSDDRRTLSPTTVRGSTLSQRRNPFVFLNACQVGQAAPDPGGYGGMAGAFVREGATGFVAPLWEVADDLANRAALEFYADTLEGGLPVSEAMRRFRAGFVEGQSTRLSYVYYGHPGLRLSLADGAATDAPTPDQPAPDRP